MSNTPQAPIRNSQHYSDSWKSGSPGLMYAQCPGFSQHVPFEDFSMKRFSQVVAACIAAVCVAAAGSAANAQDADGSWQGARLGFVGRMVKDLDRSVAFYKMIGFAQDPLAKSKWRTDPVIEG